MDATAQWTPRHLAAFFAAVFLISWPCFAAVPRLSFPGPILYLGIFAPALVAILITALARGRNGVVALLQPLVQWQVRARWYVFALTFMASIKLVAALLHRLTLGMWPAFGKESIFLMIAATLGSTFLGGQAGEEIGWRGFALPALASHLGYGRASLLLGVIWALWHLPLIFVPQADTYHQSFILYTLQVTAMSVAIAWLYVRTNGSLLLTMLMHAAVNNTKDIVPSTMRGGTTSWTIAASPIGSLTVALLWLAAAYFLFRMRRASEQS